MAFFTDPIFVEGVLPFLLVFVLVFAILQKSKLFGENKNQIDALISLAIALMLIAFPTPRDYIVEMVPWLAVALVVLLIFLLIYGFVDSGENGINIPDWVKNLVLILGIIFVAILALVITGQWDNFLNWFSDDVSSETWANVLIIVAIAVAMWFAMGAKWPLFNKKEKGN